MALLEISTLITLWGISTGGYSIVSGVTTGKKLDKMYKKMKAQDSSITEIKTNQKKISTDISMIKNAYVITEKDKNETFIEIPERELVSHTGGVLSNELNDFIITSEFVKAPVELAKIIQKNPENVLWGIERLENVKPWSDDESLIAILFEDRGHQMVGWQKPEIINLLLGLKVNENEWFNHSQNINNNVTKSKMTTQCPDCNTRFLITKEELNKAHGLVRCGMCFKVFSADLMINHLL